MCELLQLVSWSTSCGTHSFRFAVFCGQAFHWNGRAQLRVVLIAFQLGANCSKLLAVSLSVARSRVGFYRMKLHALVISFCDDLCYKACLRSCSRLREACVASRSRDSDVSTWLILPVVICLSQRLSHACLSISFYTAKLRMAH